MDTLTESAAQTTSPQNLTRANIGDEVSFTQAVKPSLRGPGRTIEAHGVVTEVTTLSRFNATRLVVDGVPHVVLWGTPVTVTAAPGKPQRKIPGTTRATTRTDDQSYPGNGSYLIPRFAGELTAADVATRIEVDIEAMTVYGRLDRVGQITGMVSLVIDGQSFVVEEDKPVTLVVPRRD